MAALEGNAVAQVEADHSLRRRDFINIAAVSFAGVGAVAVALPLINQMSPSADVLALASTEVDISKIAPGQAIKTSWRKQPVFVRNLTPQEIAAASAHPQRPGPAQPACAGLCVHVRHRRDHRLRGLFVMSFAWAKPYEPKTELGRWFDDRMPLPRLVYNAVGGGYPVPRNLNYGWNFGVLSGIFLTIQIVTGIVLAMWYFASADGAFNSVEHIMRDVNAGWMMRYAHANGASFFFIVVYIHIFRGLYYGSYKAPREMVWLLGLVIYLLMMATAFMGYVLPWGQMSFWGAQVITGFFSAFPVVGEPIRVWLLGGYAPDQAALTRFFSLHYLLPFVIAGVVILHIWSLHIPGSSNPTGVDVKSEKDTLPFHPFYTAKDGWFAALFLTLYAIVLFFLPNYLGHPDNYIPANPLATPAHIVPEWYFWPFYA